MSGIKQKITTESIEEFAERATKIYGQEIIENRVVPDYRDGLKPVQRAILWTMYNLKLHYNGPYKKAARTVGDCFVAGTQVSTPNGDVNIEDLVVGDLVNTRYGEYPVTECYIMPEQSVYEVTLEDGKVITVTGGQKFVTLRACLETWVTLSDITEADSLLVSSDNNAYVKIVSIKEKPAQVTYDIQVQDVHELIANGIVAHNCIGMYWPHGDKCLRHNTLVPLADGTRKTIAELTDLNEPQYVFAYDFDTEEMKVVRAEHWRVGQETTTMYRIELATGEHIECTGNHPFYVKGIGWKRADELTVAKAIAGGTIVPNEKYIIKYALIKRVTVMELEEPEQFYDFSVKYYENMVIYSSEGANTHNFVIAHNSTYDAMVGLANTPVQMIDGYGNWGSHVDKPAAMRYSMRGDTRVLTEYGLIQIQNLPQQLGYSVNEDIIDIDVVVPSLYANVARASKWMYNGERECFLVTTRCGITISSTKDHKYYVYKTDGTYEFVRLEELQVGDYLCVANNFVQSDVDDTTKEEDLHTIKMLAYTYCISQKGENAEFATRDSQIVNDFGAWLTKHDAIYQYEKVDKAHTFIINDPKVVQHIKDTQAVFPEYLYQASVSEVAMFLRTFFECKSRVHGVIHTLSFDYEFLKGLQLLLLSYFGIVSSIRKMELCYKIVIERISLKRFFDCIGFATDYKQKKLQALYNDQNFKEYGDYYYDAIVSIVPDGVHPVYDLSVEETNAFVANGLMVHNCFVAGTKVMTEHGLVNIERIPHYLGDTRNPIDIDELETNYQVSSTTTGSKAVKWLNSGRHNTVIVTTELGYQVQCTDNQPFLILNENLDYEWKPISEFKAGDSLCLGGGYNDYHINSKISPDTAYLIGLLTKAVISDDTILYSDYVDRVKRLAVVEKCIKAFFDITTFTESEKNSKKYYYVVHTDDIKTRFSVLNWNEYTSFVPLIIFESGEAEVANFCKAIFFLYGRLNNGAEYTINSRSYNLLVDVKQLLLNFFGITTDKIQEDVYGYYKVVVLDYDICEDVGIIPESITRNMNRIHYVNKIPHFRKWLHNQVLEALVRGEYSYNDIGQLQSLSEYSPVLYRQLYYEKVKEASYRIPCIYKDSNCPIIFKLRSIIDTNYIYDTVKSIEPAGEQYVFDLTVNDTHAFFANGFIAHNTEARLSEYSDKFLLDPEYVKAMPMIKNFSEDRLIPAVLPAKVPNALLTGNTSIAVGISASSPPFELKGVLALTRLHLSGTVLTPELCFKHLRFNYKYGGKCISGKEDLLQFFQTGAGTLQFIPEYEFNLLRRTLQITSTCPGLSSENTITSFLKKVADIPGVRLVHDAEDAAGIKYVIEFSKIGEEKIRAAVATIEKMLVRSERYDFGVIDKQEGGITFFRTNPIDIIQKWCTWRSELESVVISKRIERFEQECKEAELLALAVASIDIIAEALKKPDSEKYLITKLRITEEEAESIMRLQLAQLKRANKATIAERIKDFKTRIKQCKADLRDVEALLVTELSNIKNC